MWGHGHEVAELADAAATDDDDHGSYDDGYADVTAPTAAHHLLNDAAAATNQQCSTCRAAAGVVAAAALQRARGRAMVLVDVTAALAQLLPGVAYPCSCAGGAPPAPAGALERRYAVACVLTRLVNGVSDSAQTGASAVSVLAQARRVGLPRLLGAGRHETPHGALPTLPVPHAATRMAAGWLWERYWRGQAGALVSVLDIDVAAPEAVVGCPPPPPAWLPQRAHVAPTALPMLLDGVAAAVAREAGREAGDSGSAVRDVMDSLTTAQLLALYDAAARRCIGRASSSTSGGGVGSLRRALAAPAVAAPPAVAGASAGAVAAAAHLAAALCARARGCQADTIRRQDWLAAGVLHPILAAMACDDVAPRVWLPLLAALQCTVECHTLLACVSFAVQAGMTATDGGDYEALPVVLAALSSNALYDLCASLGPRASRRAVHSGTPARHSAGAGAQQQLTTFDVAAFGAAATPLWSSVSPHVVAAPAPPSWLFAAPFASTGAGGASAGKKRGRGEVGGSTSTAADGLPPLSVEHGGAMLRCFLLAATCAPFPALLPLVAASRLMPPSSLAQWTAAPPADVSEADDAGSDLAAAAAAAAGDGALSLDAFEALLAAPILPPPSPPPPPPPQASPVVAVQPTSCGPRWRRGIACAHH